MTTPTEDQEQKPTAQGSWSGESPDTHTEREDERWSTRSQMRDWLVLILLMAAYLVWVGIIYFLEPGIR